MLKWVHINNVLSCRDVVIDDIQPITALVGRNGAGKTNILKAIDWLARSATTSVSPSPLSWPKSKVSVRVRLDGGIFNYTIASSYRQSGNSQAKGGSRRFGVSLVEELTVENNSGRTDRLFSRSGKQIQTSNELATLAIAPDAPCMPALIALLPSEAELVQRLRPLLNYLLRIRYYPIDEPSDANEPKNVSGEEYDDWLQEHKANGTSDDSVVMRLLDAYLSRKELFEEIGRLLGKDGLGVIDSIRVNISEPENDFDDSARRKSTFHVVSFKPGGGPVRATPFSSSIQYGKLSLGTRRVLRILVSLLFDKSSLALLEHPEDGIHRGLLRKLVDLIRTNADDGQVIVSSHSPAFFDMLRPEEIRLVSMQDGETFVRPLNEKELVAAKQYLESEGSLSDFVESIEEE